MKVTTHDGPMVILGLVLAVIGLVLYPHLTWLAAIGVGLVIGAYLKVELEHKKEV